jgi:HSP20 family protein
MVNLLTRELDRLSPWARPDSWFRDFDQLFSNMDRMLVPLRMSSQQNFVATCDIHETEGDYHLALDMPGMAKEDINVEIVGKQVTISGERKRESTGKEATEHRLERSYGYIKRTFSLPSGVEAEKIQANYDSGVLYLTIPKLEAEKSKKISIGSGKGGSLKNIMGKALEPKAKAANHS